MLVIGFQNLSLESVFYPSLLEPEWPWIVTVLCWMSFRWVCLTLSKSMSVSKSPEVQVWVKHLRAPLLHCWQATRKLPLKLVCIWTEDAALWQFALHTLADFFKRLFNIASFVFKQKLNAAFKLNMSRAAFDSVRFSAEANLFYPLFPSWLGGCFCPVAAGVSWL